MERQSRTRRKDRTISGRDVELGIESAYLEQAVRILVDRAPEGWKKLEYTMRSTIGTDNVQLLVDFEGKDTETISSPIAAVDVMYDLRGAMYQEGRGTWFTAKVTIHRSLAYETEFDYDSEPAFVPPLCPGSFAQDLEYFPRDEEHVPHWLRCLLEQDRQSLSDPHDDAAR